MGLPLRGCGGYSFADTSLQCSHHAELQVGLGTSGGKFLQIIASQTCFQLALVMK
jgi:hypothetical protein